MVQDEIVGFCRFSFVGRGDWQAFRDIQGQPPELLDRVAQNLFDPLRLEQRFRSFAQLTLASVRAQTDPDFVFVVLASDRLDPVSRARLQALCDPVPQVGLIFSDAPTLSEALHPVLAELRHDSRRNVIQFRLDDDDAIPGDYIANLRRHAERLADLDRFAISFNRGLMVKLAPGQAPVPLAYALPFLGAGCAISDGRDHKLIFEIGHFQIAKLFTHIQDIDHPGALVTRWTDSDSKELVLDALPRNITRLRDWRFRRQIRRHFPFLNDVDFASLLTPPPA
ncbi:glycosyltransferase [Paracoccus sp. p1-h21]|uniref:glycosyltransferase n=1 Tax=Paracoccus sp. p1-h21 TaxID=3366951 RepID=UPI0037ABA7B1